MQDSYIALLQLREGQFTVDYGSLMRRHIQTERSFRIVHEQVVTFAIKGAVNVCDRASESENSISGGCLDLRSSHSLTMTKTSSLG